MEFNLIGFIKSGIDTTLMLKVAETTVKMSAVRNDGQINIKLVSKEVSRQLNRQYAGNDYATDVLSFAYGPDVKEIGDIAICLEVAEDQAKQAGISLQTELATLIIHGILHLLGYDHQDKIEQPRFYQLQSGIVKKLGLSKQD